MRIGEKIRVLRKEKGLTQKQLAEKCYLSPKTIFNIEKNINNPKIDDLQRIATALKVDISYFQDQKKLYLSEEEYEELKKAKEILNRIIK